MTIEELLARAEPGPGGCLLWTGPIGKNGYAQVTIQQRKYYVHRLVFEAARGSAAGLDVDHCCHNEDEACDGGSSCLHRRCINLEHLEAVEHAENVRRGRGGRMWAERTHCPHGHEYTEANTRVYDGRRFCRACNSKKFRAQKQAANGAR